MTYPLLFWLATIALRTYYFLNFSILLLKSTYTYLDALWKCSLEDWVKLLFADFFDSLFSLLKLIQLAFVGAECELDLILYSFLSFAFGWFFQNHWQSL